MSSRRTAVVRSCAGLALALALGACARGGVSASGASRADEVALVVGEGVAPMTADLLQKALEREAAPGGSEPLLHVERVAATGLGRARGKRALVLLANMSVPGAAARAAREVLSAEEAADAGAGTGSFFLKKDAWASGQTILVVSGASAQDVLGLVESRSEKMREALLAAAREHVARDLFREGENQNSRKRLAMNFGWAVRVPAAGWRMVEHPAAPPEGAGRVRFEAAHPNRAVTVLWMPADSTRLAPAEGIALLGELATSGGLGGALDPASARAVPGAFLGRRSLRVVGVRRVASKRGGVSFEADLFLGGAPERLFVVDRAVESGGGANGSSAAKIAMWELDAIAATFRSEASDRAAPP